MKYVLLAIFLLLPNISYGAENLIKCPADYPFKGKLPSGSAYCGDCNDLWSLDSSFARIKNDCLNLEGMSSYNVNMPESKWCSKFIADMLLGKAQCEKQRQDYLDAKAKEQVDLDMVNTQ